MSDRTVSLIVSVIGGIVAVVLVRWVLHRAYLAMERRQRDKGPSDMARRRTTWLFVQRVILALVASVAVWIVLAQFSATQTVAQALIASSAVLALLVGLAFNVPLSNLGSGMLVAFAQPLRLGDRVTIGEHTGFVEEMSLLYTTLATDDARRVAIPNTQLTSSAIVNRTIRDPRRLVYTAFPVPLATPLAPAISALQTAAEGVAGVYDGPQVLVGEIAGGTVRLDVNAYAALDADVTVLQSEIRRMGLAALDERGLLAP